MTPTDPTAPPDYRPLGCRECLHGADLGFELTMAFQPILDLDRRAVFAYESLVRAPDGQGGAAAVLAKVHDGNRYRFDQVARVKSIELASRLGLETYLSINFLPNAVYRAETCIRTTLAAAQEYGFPAKQILFEVTEAERVQDHAHLAGIIREYRRLGFLTAIDDFGAGYAGLNLLADFQPDIVKLDMALVRGIDADRNRRAIVRGILGVCTDMEIRVIAEGLETPGELAVIRDLGISLVQGFLFARPGFESLPVPDWGAAA